MHTQEGPGPVDPREPDDSDAFTPAPELDIAAMRAAYPAGTVTDALDERALDAGWTALLQRWLREASLYVGPDGLRVAEPNAMVIATVDEQGRPQSRTVLCKGVDERGVSLFTNYESDKGRALAARPYAAVTFPWYAMHRQAHLRGAVERLSAEETERYWRTRPRGSQLGAWASAQSRPAGSRAELEDAYAAAERRFAGVADIPVPSFWGGLLIRPELVEFWQGRPDRMHDRIRATRSAGGAGWDVTRLQP